MHGKKTKKTKIKGDSPSIAAQMREGRAQGHGSVGSYTENGYAFDVPLELGAAGGISAVTATTMASSPGGKHKKEKKLKGESPEIADNLFDGRAQGYGGVGSYTDDGYANTMPLHLAAAGGITAVAATTMASSPDGKHSRKKENKLKGESAEIADNLMENRAQGYGGTGSYTGNGYANNIPLELAGAGGISAVAATTMASSPDGKQKKKKENKLKGDSAEIADNLFEGKRGMSGDYTTYTGEHTTVPLRLSHDDILSTGGKGFGPVIGAKGSYNLETTPDLPTGTYRATGGEDWDVNGGAVIVQKSSTDAVQHSQPSFGSPAVVVAPGSPSKQQKSLLKGDSAEIASNLVDAGSSRHSRSSYEGGNPYCGANGVTAPLSISLANKNAQLEMYGAVEGVRKGSISSHSSRRGSRSRSYSPGHLSDTGIALAASHEANVYAAPPSVEIGKSATLPAGGSAAAAAAGAGASATLPAVGVVAAGGKGKDKKDKKPRLRHRTHSQAEGEEKLRKRDRMSAFFRRIFKKKKKGGKLLQTLPFILCA